MTLPQRKSQLKTSLTRILVSMAAAFAASCQWVLGEYHLEDSAAAGAGTIVDSAPAGPGGGESGSAGGDGGGRSSPGSPSGGSGNAAAIGGGSPPANGGVGATGGKTTADSGGAGGVFVGVVSGATGGTASSGGNIGSGGDVADTGGSTSTGGESTGSGGSATGGDSTGNGGSGGESTESGGAATGGDFTGTGGTSDPVCSGALYDGICWYLGPTGASCVEACANHGGVSAQAASYVGTTLQGGSLEECATLLELLDLSGTVSSGTRTSLDQLGLGCHVLPNNSPPNWWLSAPDFSATDSLSGARIVCGCLE